MTFYKIKKYQNIFRDIFVLHSVILIVVVVGHVFSLLICCCFGVCFGTFSTTTCVSTKKQKVLQAQLFNKSLTNHIAQLNNYKIYISSIVGGGVGVNGFNNKILCTDLGFTLFMTRWQPRFSKVNACQSHPKLCQLRQIVKIFKIN